MIDLVRGRLSPGTITTINDNRAALGDEPHRDLFADPEVPPATIAKRMVAPLRPLSQTNLRYAARR